MVTIRFGIDTSVANILVVNADICTHLCKFNDFCHNEPLQIPG